MRLFPVLITLLVALAFLAPDVIANRKVVVEIYDGPGCESSKLEGPRVLFRSKEVHKTEIRSINPFVRKDGGVAVFNTTHLIT